MKASEYSTILEAFEEAVYPHIRSPRELEIAEAEFRKYLFKKGISIRSDATYEDVKNFLMDDWRSYRDIQDRYGLSKSTVLHWINRVQKEGHKVKKKMKGRRMYYKVVK